MMILITLASLCIVSTISAQKKSITIETSMQVNVPAHEAFDALRSLESFASWSPFVATDPHQKNYVTGTDGAIGSKFHWEGVGEKTKGVQTLTEIIKDELVRYDCEITKPFKGKPTFLYHIQKVDGGVRIVQHFELRLSPFALFMTKLFGVKKKMITANELGMKRLKSYLEKNAQISYLSNLETFIK